jgi:exonuclease VII large subunit
MEQKGLDFGAGAGAKPGRRPALTVSALTDRLQGVLETEFFDVWVEGEISNLTQPASGHWYFSLKDERAQVRAVLWKTAARLVKWKPRDGMRVLVRGGVKVYAPRGDYQLQVEVVEPLGKGSLQQAYEELKERLEKEGLFAAARKRPLPMLPRCIGIVTSPTGAVIQDILRVLSRRYANLGILIYPARVQGPEASGEIQQGIKALNRFKSVDVIMVARVRHDRTDLGRVAGKLDSLSPLAVLSRGYALAFDGGGHLVQRASQVAPGDTIDVRLADGRVRATVTETRKAEE